MQDEDLENHVLVNYYGTNFVCARFNGQGHGTIFLP
jgi:hypothetical protein